VLIGAGTDEDCRCEGDRGGYGAYRRTESLVAVLVGQGPIDQIATAVGG
jgi:hypothetical protein